MSKYLLLNEVKHEQYFVTDYNEYGEEVETTLPENVKVYTEISESDLKEGMHSLYSVAY